MKIRITLTFSPDLGDTTRWPGCKTGQDVCDRIFAVLSTLFSWAGLRAHLEVISIAEDRRR